MVFSRFFQSKPQSSVRSTKWKGKEVLLYGLMTAGSFALTSYFVKKSFSQKWIAVSVFCGLTGLQQILFSLWDSEESQPKFSVTPLVADPKDLFPEFDPTAEVPKILRVIKEAMKHHELNKTPPPKSNSPTCVKMGSIFKDFVDDLNEKADLKRFNCTNYNTTKQEYLKMFMEVQKVITGAEVVRDMAKHFSSDNLALSEYINYYHIWVILVQQMREIDLLNYSYAETAEERKQFPDDATDRISYQRIENAYRILIQGDCLNNCGHNARKIRDELRKLALIE